MNEIDFVIGVLISSGAGYLLGKHYERKKAMVAFRNFQHSVVHSTIATTNGIIDVVVARLPNVDMKVLMQDIVVSCAKYGAQITAFNPATGDMVKGPATNDNTPKQ